MPDQTSVRQTALTWAITCVADVVGGTTARRLRDVVDDAGAAERGVDQDAGAERADDAADAVDAEHVEASS